MIIRFPAVLVLLTLGSAGLAQSVAEGADDIEGKARSAAENPAIVSAELQRSLDQVIEQLQSPEWLRTQQDWRRDIARLTGRQAAADIDDQRETSGNPTQDRLIVFVSSSIPLQTLRNYAKDLEKINGLMVFRGMLGGMRSITPTLKLVANLLRINPACEGQHCAMRKTNVVIDPMLFRQHGILSVPAAVFVQDMPLTPYCDQSGEQLKSRNDQHIVYGDLSLKSLAEELRRVSKSQRLDLLIRSL